jgi:ABC-type Fe3+-hydroxamate transport system substrate-binding protein
MKRRIGFLAAGLTVALVAVGGTAFAAVSPASPTGVTGPQVTVGPGPEVTGAVNPNCTLQGNSPASIVTSGQVSPGVCQLTFGASDFSNVPILLVTPINGGGGNPTSIIEGRNGDGTWYARYSFSAPTLLNFIASQLTS